MGATEIGSKMFTTGSLKEYIPGSADAFNLYLTNQKSKILDIVKNFFVTAIESGVKLIDESVPVGFDDCKDQLLLHLDLQKALLQNEGYETAAVESTKLDNLLKVVKSAQGGTQLIVASDEMKRLEKKVTIASQMVTTTYALFTLHQITEKSRGKALGTAAKRLHSELRDKKMLNALARDIKDGLELMLKGVDGADAKSFLEQLEAARDVCKCIE